MKLDRLDLHRITYSSFIANRGDYKELKKYLTELMKEIKEGDIISPSKGAEDLFKRQQQLTKRIH